MLLRYLILFHPGLAIIYLDHYYRYMNLKFKQDISKREQVTGEVTAKRDIFATQLDTVSIIDPIHSTIPKKACLSRGGGGR